MKIFFYLILISGTFFSEKVFAIDDSVNVVQVVGNTPTSTATTSTTTNIFNNFSGGLAFILDTSIDPENIFIPIGYFSTEEGRFIFYDEPSNAPTLKPEIYQEIQENIAEDTLLEDAINSEDESEEEIERKDICLNLPGTQVRLPESFMEKDGNCYVIVEKEDFLTHEQIKTFTHLNGLKLVEYVGFSGILNSVQGLFLFVLLAVFSLLLFLLLKLVFKI